MPVADAVALLVEPSLRPDSLQVEPLARSNLLPRPSTGTVSASEDEAPGAVSILFFKLDQYENGK